MEFALLVLRLAVGLTFVAHAAQKLLRAFGGQAIQSTADAFDQLGLVRAGSMRGWRRWPSSAAASRCPRPADAARRGGLDRNDDRGGAHRSPAHCAPGRIRTCDLSLRRRVSSSAD